MKYRPGVGILKLRHADCYIALPARCVIGRAPLSGIRLEHASVSGEHARLLWSEGGWNLRDLGSRNGTLLNDERLGAGESRALAEGDRIVFGSDSQTWELVSSAPPSACARDLRTGQLVTGEDAWLAIPDATSPRCVLFAGADGWMVEDEAGARLVGDGDVVLVGDAAWALHLPNEGNATVDAARPQVADLTLQFRVSTDQENVEILVHGADAPLHLPHRMHNYLLLLLARERARDREHHPTADRGWLHVEELCSMLRVDAMRLNTEVFRARREWSALPVSDPIAIVERRRSSRQLRIGTERFIFE